MSVEWRAPVTGNVGLTKKRMSQLWGPIDLNRWRETPAIAARVARESDVRAGTAVFFLEDPERIGATPLELEVPCCAVWRNDDGVNVPVVVVQAEEAEGKTYIGFRFLEGGNGLCALEELELLDSPDERFLDPGRESGASRSSEQPNNEMKLTRSARR